jgi:uncharacterized protein (DUF1810 family)
MTETDLEKFVTAQDPVFERVRDELAAGKKQSHWMWFIFPQLAGLGLSPIARHFAIGNLDEARRYLDHPVLGERLRACCRLMLLHEGKSANDILGSPDDMKFRSCLTLFLNAAVSPADYDLFAKALSAFYGGVPDQRTTALLSGTSASQI